MVFNTTVSPSETEPLLSNKQPLPPSILYHDEQVTLIDIPRSIADAQGSCLSSSHRSLVSSLPLTSPYPSNEPKSDAAKARLRAKMATAYDDLYADCISNAISLLKNNHRGNWCLPRVVVVAAADDPVVGNKRKASHLSDQQATTDLDHHMLLQHHQSPAHDSPPPLSDVLQHLSGKDEAMHRRYTLQWDSLCGESTNDPICDQPRMQATTLTDWDHHLFNISNVSRTLNLTTNESRPTTFIIPPHANCHLNDCGDARSLHAAVRNQAQEQDTLRKFDVIIMDPPWPNASVKRAQRTAKSGYQMASSMWDIRQLIFAMDLDVLLATDGLIAIWITNRPAVRELVLGEDGLFDSWGVTLEEEWLWIKTTHSGDPVSALNALWRKPYEVLLLGRRRHPSLANNVGELQHIKRRVIAGVPDLHSRKPCLKSLIELCLLPDRPRYRALEIFARYLVAGWWSWGNEVLRFNHENCWSGPP